MRAYPELHVTGLVRLHAIACHDGILTADHLDEGMTLVNVDDARLDDAKFAKERAKMRLRRPKRMLIRSPVVTREGYGRENVRDTSNEKSTTQDYTTAS